jgi:hypothetical protein
MGAWPGVCPPVKPVAPTGFCRVCRLWWRAFAGLDDGEGEFLELGEQRAELFRVVEQRLPGGELLGGEPAGDGLAADLACPLGVGAVPVFVPDIPYVSCDLRVFVDDTADQIAPVGSERAEVNDCVGQRLEWRSLSERAVRPMLVVVGLVRSQHS